MRKTVVRLLLACMATGILSGYMPRNVARADGETFITNNIHECDHSTIESTLSNIYNEVYCLDEDYEETTKAFFYNIGPGTLADIIRDEYVWFKELDEFRQHLEEQIPNVTEVYSLNRQVDNCPWQPSYEELNGIAGADDAIAALVGQAGASYLSNQAGHSDKDSAANDDSEDSGRFASVYTGTFNNGGYFSQDAVLGGVKYVKPQGKTCRALEILGYDMLIRSDEFKVSRKYTNEAVGLYSLTLEYESEPMPDKLTWADAVMSIYKALDQNILKTEYWVYADKGLNKLNTMAAANLASYVHDVNGYYTLVFATRTVRDGYWKRAVSELGLVDAYKDIPISYGEFIVLLAELMEYCGEPVMSDIEMHALLQVYGATVPTYLNQRQQQAYLYLKARGVLNEEFDYIEQIDLMKILDILMCVKDKGSRTNFKEIQVTYDIGDELVSMGYFPKEVSIATGDKAVTYDIEYDYASAQAYDYFVEVCEETTFKDELGRSVSNLFVAKSVYASPNEGAYDGSQYLGIYTDEDNKQWYHFIVPAEYSGLVLINTPASADRPKHVTLRKSGGGFYTFESVGTGQKEDITYMKRESFEDGTMERYVDKERKESAEKEAAKKEAEAKNKKSFWQRVADVLFPTTIAYAAEELNNGQAEAVRHNTYAHVKLKLYNPENIEYSSVESAINAARQYNQSEDLFSVDTSNSKYWIVTLPEPMVEWFTSRIQRNDSNITVKYTAITSLSGDNLLVSYNDLVAHGVLINTTTEGVPIPEPGTNDQLLVLYTTQGEIRINNETREIVVGNNVYRVRNDGTLLFKYIAKDGENVLLIDFRTVYGWSSDRVNLSIMGTGSNVSVNATYNTDAVYYANVRSARVELPYSFKSTSDDLSMDVIPVGIIQDSVTPKLPMTSSYCLANWVMYQKYDTSSGKQLDYLIVFYPTVAFTGTSMPDNNGITLEDIAGYAVNIDKDWTYRIFELNGNTSNKPGEMTYTEEYGFVYNVPAWNDFNMKDYLSGKYMLPISHDMTNHVYINANVNYFANITYGNRPVDSSGSVDIKGNKSNNRTNSNPVCYAAPAGIASFFGIKTYKVFQAKSEMLKEQVSKNKASVYFGTSKCEVETDEGSVRLKVKYNNNGSYTSEFKAKEDTYFYRVQTRAYSNKALVSSYIAFDKALNFTKSELPESEVQAPEIEIIDGEAKDAFDDDKGFTFNGILNAIDSGASFVIVFVFVLFPLAGIIAVTILAGLVIMGDSKICKKFAERVFDPVKILTFGARSLQEYRLRDCMWSLCIGYTIFGLMYDGNVIRVMQWVLTAFGKLAEYIKYI